MFEKEAKATEPKYISCFKINGVPILPPLITHAKRKQIHKYKQQAVKLEKRLRRERELKDYINKYYTPKLENCTNILFANTLEHRLSFDNLILLSKDNENLTRNSAENEVAFTLQKKTSKLSCDLQVSQYANNEFTVLTSFDKGKSSIVVIEEPASFACNNNALEHEAKLSDITNQKPALIRSNSYVLETPSPMLLEHLRRQNEYADDCIKESSANSQAIRSNQDDGIFIDELSSRDLLSISRSESELKNMSVLSDQISENGDFTIIESQHQLKEFIDNNLPQMLDNNLIFEDKQNGTKEKLHLASNTQHEDYLNSSYENVDYSNIVSLSDPLTNCNEQSLRKILYNIPEMYSKQIIDLLEKQKREKLKFKKHNVNEPFNCNAKIETDSKTESSIYDKVQGINSFLNSDQNNWNKLIEPQDSLQMTVTPEKVNTIPANFNQLCNKTDPCSCELFSSSNKKIRQPLKEDHAATLIVAAAKGYLTRRLMRTDRIQGLIQTIRDALVCAMQLHSECTETINESDVELHRRLIQQVSAACFEFHDVFFSLSAPEQMTIIRLDRERQKEKLKRPLSRASSISKSSRSSRSITK